MPSQRTPPITIDYLPIYRDNYVWVIINTALNEAYVVDPGDSKPVLHFLEQNKLTLAGILVTHRHWDHISGIANMIQAFPVTVYGPEHEDIPWVTHKVKEGCILTLWEHTRMEVWASPGHVPEQVSYLLKTDKNDVFFGGDTLFSCGCSRIFDGSPGELKKTVDRIADLPDTTRICTSHEYTLANIQFAETVEPNNSALQKFKRKAQKLRTNNHATLPIYSNIEKEVNPFLRCNIPAVIVSVEKHTGQTMANELEVFAALRRWKDTF